MTEIVEVVGFESLSADPAWRKLQADRLAAAERYFGALLEQDRKREQERKAGRNDHAQ